MQFIIASSREPNGVTWLVNCLLELKIKTQLGDNMWTKKEKTFILNPQFNLLKKWLPSLSKYSSFSFVENIEVIWTHSFPNETFSNHPVIYFTRDPRDSLFSRYKRENPNMIFSDFLNFPDSNTLLNKVDNWCLHNILWLNHKNLLLIRFEDYKSNAKTTLLKIITFLNISVQDKEIDKALVESTFEKASESEKKYLEKNLSDKESVMRFGKSGNWKNLSEKDLQTIELIKYKTNDLLINFGYIKEELNQYCYQKENYYPNLKYLSFFDKIPSEYKFFLYPEISLNITNSNFLGLVNFLFTMNEKIIKESGIRSYDTYILLKSTTEFLYNYQLTVDNSISSFFYTDKKNILPHDYSNYFTKLFDLKKKLLLNTTHVNEMYFIKLFKLIKEVKYLYPVKISFLINHCLEFMKYRIFRLKK